MPISFPSLLKIILVSVGGTGGVGYAGREFYKFVNNNSELFGLKNGVSGEISPETDENRDTKLPPPSGGSTTTLGDSSTSSHLDDPSQKHNQAQPVVTEEEASKASPKVSVDNSLPSSSPEIKIVSQVSHPQPKVEPVVNKGPIIENDVGDWGEKNGKNQVYEVRASKPIENRQWMSAEEKRKIEDCKDWGWCWDFKDNLVSSGNINQMKDSEQLKKDAKIYKMIKDHTVKLSTPCSQGTGWFLDFELPEDPSKYPTKWFVATNLHVISEIKFLKSEYENVVLPVTEESLHFYLERNKNYGGCVAFLKGDTPKLDLLTEEDVTEDPSSYEASRFKSRGGGYYQNHPLYIEMQKNAGKGTSVRAPKIYEARIENPKLVYAAINFAGDKKDVKDERKTMDYFKDFGIVQVDFQDEEVAKKITNKLFDKYYKSKVFKDSGAQSPEKSINFFAPELMSKYTAEELNNNEENFFVGGYPAGDNKGGEISFSMNQKYRWKTELKEGRYDSKIISTHSKLTHFKEYDRLRRLPGYNVTNKYGDVIRGHMGSEQNSYYDNIKIFWNGKSMNTWGYNYLIDNSFLGGGASGSMVLDENGGLLGLYTRFANPVNYGVVESVRGSQIKDARGRVIFPSFDLISGKGGKISSYRTQLEKYGKGIKTYLSQNSNWKSN
ncbi:putative lipoprotein [Mycoplasma suis KI3806]|uniref:Lipoprotein n=2 Tax=Mycoplasma suis TaxID=57372 RepID=F0V2F0_MYCS3|nr:hypothetical protein [Mycoplasma suis]CBZ40831.1 putative lipoprotein [Mycoplasma suis KI3806]